MEGISDDSRPMQPPGASESRSTVAGTAPQPNPLTIYFGARRNAARAAALAARAANAERDARMLVYVANLRVRSWAILEAGVDRIMTRLRDGIDMKSYMELYTAVHNFCTSQKSMSTIHQGAGSAQRGGKLKTWTSSKCDGHVKPATQESRVMLTIFHSTSSRRRSLQPPHHILVTTSARDRSRKGKVL